MDALKGATLTVEAGSAVALVGSSGSGKSTLAKCMAGLLVPDSGSVRFDGKSLTFPSPVQLVFQHSSLAINPAFTVARAIAEPLEIARAGSMSSRRADVIRRMEEMELPAFLADSPVADSSGGERARIALARALCAVGDRPGLIILDETLSSLDVPLQRRLAKRLHAIRSRRAVSILLITHDWNLALCFTDTLLVMDNGQVREPDCEAGRILAAAAPPLLPKAQDV